MISSRDVGVNPVHRLLLGGRSHKARPVLLRQFFHHGPCDHVAITPPTLGTTLPYIQKSRPPIREGLKNPC